MCMQRTCPTCQKSTWWGCGQHIPRVMDSIPESDRCTCTPTTEVDGKVYPPKSGEGKAAKVSENKDTGAAVGETKEEAKEKSGEVTAPEAGKGGEGGPAVGGLVGERG